jgi:hypothetical protein
MLGGLSAAQVRSRIGKFLATKEMSQKDFMLAIGGVNSSSLRTFLAHKGDKGYGSCVYSGASAFFGEREAEAKQAKVDAKAAEKAMPAADRKRKREDEKSDAAAKKASSGDMLDAAAAVTLPLVANAGQDEDEALVSNSPAQVAIFDNCDEVRQKGLDFLNDTGTTKAAFLKACDGLNNNSWGKFVACKGPEKGRGNKAYRAVFSFLERIRVARGEAKTAKRLKNEANLGSRGFSCMPERTGRPPMFFTNPRRFM